MIFELVLLGGAAAVFLDNRRSRPGAPVCQQLKKEYQSCSKPCGRKKSRQMARTVRDLVTDRHRQQLKLELEPARAEALAKVRQENQQAMLLSLTAFSFSLLGKIILPFVSVSIAIMLYLLTKNIENIRKDFQRRQYVSTHLLGLVMVLGLIFTDNVVFAALSVLSGSFFSMLVNLIEENSQQQLISVFSEHSTQVWLLKDGVELQTDFHSLQSGDLIVVNAGEMIPADGRITDGEGLLDQHLLTGESLPVEKSAGDAVAAATLLLSGRLVIAVAGSGEAAMAAEVNEMLDQTQQHKDSLVLRGRRIYEHFAPVTLGLSAVTLPVLGADAALAVLWSDMGSIAADAGAGALLNALHLLAQEGILVKDGRVFEALQDVDTIAFDKTGILTLPQPTVGKIHLFAAEDEKTALCHAAAAEHRQQHPIARAILARAAAEQLAVPLPEKISAVAGGGVKVVIDGQTIIVGSARFLKTEGVVIPQAALLVQQQTADSGHTLIYVSVDSRLAGILELEPALRPEAASVIQQLQERNITCCILSGDQESTVKHAARQLGIEEYCTAATPVDKFNYINALQKKGRSVCFVGDGLNDVMALKNAHVSVSVKGAADAAVNTAQVVFTDGNLNKLLNLFDRSSEFERLMKRNYFISVAPSAFTIAGVYLLHFRITASFVIFSASCAAAFCNAAWPMLKR
jgi:Cu2+-exporting ATPase